MSDAHTARISDRDRRALRLGLRLAAPALLYGFAVKPYVASIRGANVQLETQSDLFAREQALVADAAFIPRRIAIARVARVAAVPAVGEAVAAGVGGAGVGDIAAVAGRARGGKIHVRAERHQLAVFKLFKMGGTTIIV